MSDSTAQPGPLTTFPLRVAVYCDKCGAEVEHDYVVHDLMTHQQRLDVARMYLVRNEGWSCTSDDGDLCPRCQPVITAFGLGPNDKRSLIKGPDQPR